MKQNRNLELQTEVTASDGTSLFVRVIQQPSAMGKIPLILNDGIGCSGFAWKYFIDYFQHQHPIIHWHYRGHGRSEIPENLDSMNLFQLAQDIESIMDYLCIQQAILCGHSMGVQVVLQAFQRFSERVRGLVLLCGGYEYPIKTLHASSDRHGKPTWLNRLINKVFPTLEPNISKYKELVQPFWSSLFCTELPYQTAVTLKEVNASRIKKDDFLPYFDHLGTMQAHVFMNMLKNYSKHSAKHILAEIDKPTLVVCGGKDTFAPHWVSVDMHHAIDNSELLYIPDGTHCSPIEHPELIHLRVEKFLWSILTQTSNSRLKESDDLANLTF